MADGRTPAPSLEKNGKEMNGKDSRIRGNYMTKQGSINASKGMQGKYYCITVILVTRRAKLSILRSFLICENLMNIAIFDTDVRISLQNTARCHLRHISYLFPQLLIIPPFPARGKQRRG